VIAAHPAGLEAAAARRRTRQWHVGPQERRVPALLAAIVISTVAGLYDVQDSSITGSRRHPYLVEARRIACQLLFEHGYGVYGIGLALGRDHSTVTHSLRMLETRMSREEWDCLQHSRRLVRQRIAAARERGALL
jgi:chromosomal replication initiation ATPase DnaA